MKSTKAKFSLPWKETFDEIVISFLTKLFGSLGMGVFARLSLDATKKNFSTPTLGD
ncbi:hypothetical protein [Noviherbaspirillum sp.]|uniref:hypothetical protein n=1 Tax=Noviherbaspirillum sp. TaxID=1926288 RepID=UPI002FDF9F9B